MQTIRNGLGDGRPRSPRDSSHLAEAKAAWAELLDPADAGRHPGSTDGRAISVQSLGEALVWNPDVAFQVGFLAGTRYVTLVQDGLGRVTRPGSRSPVGFPVSFHTTRPCSSSCVGIRRPVSPRP